MMKLLLSILLTANLVNFGETIDLTKTAITDDILFSLLDDSIDQIASIKSQYNRGEKDEALSALALYFRNKMSNSYFFDWTKIQNRFKKYSEKYPDKLIDHIRRKTEHFNLCRRNCRR